MENKSVESLRNQTKMVPENESGGLLNRRSWLTVAGAAAGALAGGPIALSAAPSLKPKNTHISLAAYSCRQALTSGKMDLFGFIDWCAELGLSGTELTSYYFKPDFDAKYLRDLRRRAFGNGVTVSGTAIRNDFCKPPGPEKDKEIQDVRKWIDWAAELWAPHVRIFAGEVPKGASNADAIKWVADGVKAVLDHAAERGVILGLENHGGITARAADLLAICDQVGKNPWFGVNLDTGNFHDDGYREVEMAAVRAVNVQIKVEMQDNGRTVPADLKRLRDILVKTNYKGWVALEYEAEADPFQTIPKYISEMKELFE